MTFRRTSFLLLVVGLVAAAGSGACGSDVFDVDVNLQPQTLSTDFGAAQGTIPTVICDPAQPEVCGTAAGALPVVSGPNSATVQVGCDPPTRTCFAEADATAVYPVDVLQDNDFVTKVERRSVVLVKQLDVAYTVPTNSLTFAVPAIDLWVGPPEATHATDAGVVRVGTTTPVAAGETFTDSGARHLVIQDGSAARAFLQQSIMSKQTVVFIATLSPRLGAGAALPAGALVVDLLPRLTIGF